MCDLTDIIATDEIIDRIHDPDYVPITDWERLLREWWLEVNRGMP